MNTNQPPKPRRHSPDEDAWHRMDHFGAAGIPFFFLSDFTGREVEVLPLEGLADMGVWFDFQGRTNCTELPPVAVDRHFEKHPIPYERYLAGFQSVKKHIQAGNSFLVNYTCATPIVTGFSLREIFLRANARYKVFYKDQFTFFSPETFVTIAADGRISTCPMKGTIDAGLPNARELVLADPKEAAEHNTIVDLLRNDLSQVSRQVRVERFRYVEEIRTNDKQLLQVSSEITGQLPPGWQGRLGTIFKKLLPAGSVSGAPKKKTVEIIEEAEGQVRGFYTGVAGLFDGKKWDSGVAIRFIENTGEGMVFRSGGGITCFSDPLLEYQEMIDKVYLTQPAPAPCS